MARETEEGLGGPLPAPPTGSPGRYQGGLQLGGGTTGGPQMSSLFKNISFRSPTPRSVSSAPVQSGGTFPAAPPPSLDAGPPAVGPPPSTLSAFQMPSPPSNTAELLNNAGFFSGPGSVPGAQLDPNEWLKQLFGGLSR